MIIQRVREIDSTSLELRRRLARGELLAPILLIATIQTGGVGQFGRPWHSPLGGLWMTIALPAPHAPGTPGFAHWSATLGARLGATCQEVIAQLLAGTPSQTQVTLKPPNDILIAGAKVCGLLTELLQDPAGRAWVLVGVGVNSNVPQESMPTALAYPATTLLAHRGHPIDQEHLMHALAQHITHACAHP